MVVLLTSLIEDVLVVRTLRKQLAKVTAMILKWTSLMQNMKLAGLFAKVTSVMVPVKSLDR